MRERRVTDCRPLYAMGPVHKRLGAGLRTHRSTAFIHVSLNVFRTVVRANGIGRSQKTKVERIWKDEMQTGTSGVVFNAYAHIHMHSQECTSISTEMTDSAQLHTRIHTLARNSNCKKCRRKFMFNSYCNKLHKWKLERERKKTGKHFWLRILQVETFFYSMKSNSKLKL